MWGAACLDSSMPLPPLLAGRMLCADSAMTHSWSPRCSFVLPGGAMSKPAQDEGRGEGLVVSGER